MGFEQLAALRQQLALQAKQRAGGRQADDAQPAERKQAERKQGDRPKGERGAAERGKGERPKTARPQGARTDAGRSPAGQPSGRPHGRATGRPQGERRQAERKEPVDPVLHAIGRLQKQFPQAFPKKPEPKVPLKLGIHRDLIEQAATLGLSEENLTKAVGIWCDTPRY